MKIGEVQDIKYEKEENGICTLTLNRPERKNAMSMLTFLEIETVLDYMDIDEKAKVLIITGCKEANAFSSGGYFDVKFLNSIPEHLRNEIDPFDLAQKRLCLKFWNFSKPVIAAINGLAVGAGITLPLTAADLIYMSDDSWLGFYFVKRALHSESFSSFMLPFYLGFQKAKEILYFGDNITAKEAEKLGLVNKVLPPNELMPYAREQALRLIPPKGPSLSIKLMKRTMHEYFKEILSRTLDLENEAIKYILKSSDFRESSRALKEKREPKFKGK